MFSHSHQHPHPHPLIDHLKKVVTQKLLFFEHGEAGGRVWGDT